jgi:hypothetical protein
MSKKKEQLKSTLKKDPVEAPTEKLKGDPKDQPMGKATAKPKGKIRK